MRDLPTTELEYPLDERCIAVRPAEPRDSARLMVVPRCGGDVVHAHVRDLPRWLRTGDRLVVNRTRVLRARIVGQRVAPESDGRSAPGAGTAGSAGSAAHAGVERPPERARMVEGLLLGLEADGCWRVLIRQAKRFHAGDAVALRSPSGVDHGDRLRLFDREGEAWRARLESADGAAPPVALERSGWTPLPPYILRARTKRHADGGDDADRRWYQTVFAHGSAALEPHSGGLHGSVAAPTAGLHFTPELVAAMAANGVDTLGVTLHVGPGTFKSVEAATLGAHRMHREWCSVPLETLRALHALQVERAAGRARIVAVGTTCVRTLESLPAPLPSGPSEGWSGETELLIQPGHSFRLVDALLTNFHLPRSTLLALVGAFVGLERLKELYALAQARGYRFFSYGDAMLIV